MSPVSGQVCHFHISVYLLVVKGIDELHAVSSREVWRYYTTYRHDPTLLGVLVLALWMLDTIHQGLSAHAGMLDCLVTMKAY
jgi:hypothetical protein